MRSITFLINNLHTEVEIFFTFTDELGKRFRACGYKFFFQFSKRIHSTFASSRNQSRPMIYRPDKKLSTKVLEKGTNKDNFSLGISD